MFLSIPSGLISTSVSLIGDIRTWMISWLKGVVAAPEKASDNLTQIEQALNNFFTQCPQHTATVSLSERGMNLEKWLYEKVSQTSPIYDPLSFFKVLRLTWSSAHTPHNQNPQHKTNCAMKIKNLIIKALSVREYWVSVSGGKWNHCPAKIHGIYNVDSHKCPFLTLPPSFLKNNSRKINPKVLIFLSFPNYCGLK